MYVRVSTLRVRIFFVLLPLMPIKFMLSEWIFNKDSKVLLEVILDKGVNIINLKKNVI